MKPLTLIAAVARNRVIGNGGQLPWPTDKATRPEWVAADMKHFREVTDGHAIIMGRKTFDSIGKALPNRANIVVTRDPFRFSEARGWTSLVDCCPHNSLFVAQHNIFLAPCVRSAIKLARSGHGVLLRDSSPCVIGGADIYREAIPLATDIHITMVDADFPGDVLFPEFDRDAFVEQQHRVLAGATIVTLRRQSAVDAHHQAMTFIDNASSFVSDGRRLLDAGRDGWLSKALAKERAAAAMTEAQPSRAILYRSAASIAAQLHRQADVEELVAHGLAGNPPESIARELRKVRDDVRAATENAARPKRVYIASKSRYGERWKSLREQLRGDGITVTSTWIDECGAGESSDPADLWHRCITEAADADFMIFYMEATDVLKGALVEMGAALSNRVPVILVADVDVPISVSAFNHPLVQIVHDIDEAIRLIMDAPLKRGDQR